MMDYFYLVFSIFLYVFAGYLAGRVLRKVVSSIWFRLLLVLPVFGLFSAIVTYLVHVFVNTLHIPEYGIFAAGFGLFIAFVVGSIVGVPIAFMIIFEMKDSKKLDN